MGIKGGQFLSSMTIPAVKRKENASVAKRKELGILLIVTARAISNN